MRTRDDSLPGGEPGFAGLIAQRARGLGFDAVGFARADLGLDEHHQRYRKFAAQHKHGEMTYLARHAEVRRRLDGAGILEGARTVVCLARRYDRASADEAGDPPLARRVARYARGRDYHRFMRKKLARLARFIRGLAAGARARPLCDTAPVLERAWAARAGIGFIGKNGMLILPGQGSYSLLGEVVTDLSVAPTALGSPLGSRCGSCTACLDACPTNAFDAAYQLDPRRCVAYATIESRRLPPAAMRSALGEHLFGCDRCQEVCPYNAAPAPASSSTEPFRPLTTWADLELADLVELVATDGWSGLAASPLRRATRFGLARNALLVAAAGSGEQSEGAEAALRAGLASADERLAGLAASLVSMVDCQKSSSTS